MFQVEAPSKPSPLWGLRENSHARGGQVWGVQGVVEVGTEIGSRLESETSICYKWSLASSWGWGGDPVVGKESLWQTTVIHALMPSLLSSQVSPLLAQPRSPQDAHPGQSVPEGGYENGQQ